MASNARAPIYGDKPRYKKQYWSEYQDNYFTGDGARRDKDGYFWIVGRIDDVLNVAGHRLGTSEIESALVSHPESRKPPRSGGRTNSKARAWSFSSTLKSGREAHSRPERRAARTTSDKHIGAIAKPDEVRFAEALPKTRSGKIMRRLLKEIASGANSRWRHNDPGRFQRFSKVRQRGGMTAPRLVL